MSAIRVNWTRSLALAVLVAGFGSVQTPVLAQWIEFVDETATRLVSASSLGISDSEEKDYAWGDVDQDGDIDLVVVRKQPFTSPGKRPNVLFMNESGVLVDRTVEYASDSDVPGDQGFLTPTNDRDVQLVDLNGDTWLDIVTAVTISDGDPKHIGHPRIYVNQGEDGNGDWLGFRYEEARIPTMLSYSGQSGFNPRFCSVAVGDVTGDGRPDLWFGDYDSSGAGGFGQPGGADYNDRLLVNTPSGSFFDATSARFSDVINIPGSDNTPFQVSAFGAAAAIADVNLDGVKDIVKQTSLNDPLYVGIAYNTVDDEGFFDTYEVVYDNAPYFITVADLNQDSWPDIVITDDGADRYLLNQGLDTDNLVNWVSQGFSFDGASDDGFGSNSVVTDLNNDGWPDVLIADVDVDISGCNRRMHIYRNLGGASGSNVTLQEQTTGSGCATNQGNPPSCIVASIPSNKLEGVHDVAVFDLNGDGWEDMVIGRCGSTEIYMNQPPTGLNFSYPQGLPFFISPDQAETFQIQVAPMGAAEPRPGSGRLFASINGGPFNEIFLNELVDNLYEATLPIANCGDSIEYYFRAKTTSGSNFADPPTAPAEVYSAVAAVGTEISLEDGFETDVSSWTVVNDASLVSGGWEAAVPVGTITGGGQQAAPDEDGQGSQSAVKAFVTQNGTLGGVVGEADVDGGPTDLISPPINLVATDASVTYSRWFFSDEDDTMEVSVSNDGTNWVLVETVSGTQNNWQVSSFKVGEFVVPTGTVQVRFRVSDSPNNSITEAGVDLFRVEKFLCANCGSPSECQDSLFCNGVEQCIDGACLPGADPCPGQSCDEVLDTCVECVVDAECDDGNYCNGVETCTGNTCQAGTAPCMGLCDEVNDQCVVCSVDADCDDGNYCNGEEICTGGVCSTTGDPCDGRSCDEGGDTCVGPVVLQPLMGDPLADLKPEELDRFNQGRVIFDTVLVESTGLGPIFNQNSCSSCHSKSVGGPGSITVTRFGFNDDKGVGFDPLDDMGGSLRQSQALAPQCAEIVPPEANVVAERVTSSTLGAGLVEAVDDSLIEARANTPPAGVTGRVHMVPLLEDTGGPDRVGRFGWKSQVATVLTFSADAALNEMGLTSRLLTEENAPNGDEALLALCDTQPDPEDGPDVEGFHFIDRVTDFQRFTAAPPQTPRRGTSGESLFVSVGCANCHVTALQTRDDAALEDAIRNRTIRPYSDFLLHDMGESADFIEQGGATARELRTSPLWGVRVRDPLWHDGRVAGGTFEDRMLAAIGLHDALGSEAQPSARAFFQLPLIDQDAIVDFLDSLGKPEFDLNGDSTVNGNDLSSLEACVTGPGSFYTPDDACAVADVDADGDVDEVDLALFLPGDDSDNDGTLNGADCDLFDDEVWSKPSPAVDVLFSSVSDFAWLMPTTPGGSAGVSYDVLRSTSPSDFSSAVCVETGESDLVAVDSDNPTGHLTVWYYLIRTSNGCGGNLGTDSAGSERTGAVCP